MFRTFHVFFAKVRNCVVNTFLALQRTVLNVIVQSQTSNHMFKMNLEWDESGQTMRLRRDLVRVEGVMPVLVTWYGTLYLVSVCKLVTQAETKLATFDLCDSDLGGFLFGK